MCHWIRIVSQLMFKCCYFDFVYCNFDVDHLVFEIQISFYCHLFLSANVRHRATWFPYFKVKGENYLQKITQEEVAMPFLHLFAKGAQVLNAGLRTVSP